MMPAQAPPPVSSSAMFHFLIALLIGFGANALAMDKSQVDLDFADPPLGSSWQMIPKSLMPEPGCSLYKGSFECEFKDEHGLRYLVVGTDVIRKEIDEAGAGDNPSIPFGLHFGDSAAHVRERIESTYPVILNYLVLAPEREYAGMLSTGLILKNDMDIEFGAYFLFDRSDRLKVVGVSLGQWN